MIRCHCGDAHNDELQQCNAVFLIISRNLMSEESLLSLVPSRLFFSPPAYLHVWGKTGNFPFVSSMNSSLKWFLFTMKWMKLLVHTFYGLFRKVFHFANRKVTSAFLSFLLWFHGFMAFVFLFPHLGSLWKTSSWEFLMSILRFFDALRGSHKPEKQTFSLSFQ